MTPRPWWCRDGRVGAAGACQDTATEKWVPCLASNSGPILSIAFYSYMFWMIGYCDTSVQFEVVRTQGLQLVMSSWSFKHLCRLFSLVLWCVLCCANPQLVQPGMTAVFSPASLLIASLPGKLWPLSKRICRPYGWGVLIGCSCQAHSPQRSPRSRSYPPLHGRISLTGSPHVSWKPMRNFIPSLEGRLGARVVVLLLVICVKYCI